MCTPTMARSLAVKWREGENCEKWGLEGKGRGIKGAAYTTVGRLDARYHRNRLIPAAV